MGRNHQNAPRECNQYLREMRGKQFAEAGTGQDAGQSQRHQGQNTAASVLSKALHQRDRSEQRYNSGQNAMGSFFPGQQMRRHRRQREQQGCQNAVNNTDDRRDNTNLVC
ncbi:hypothetical protein BH10ACI4_BH10ACI4_28870 [soil metagenome]